MSDSEASETATEEVDEPDSGNDSDNEKEEGQDNTVESGEEGALGVFGGKPVRMRVEEGAKDEKAKTKAKTAGDFDVQVSTNKLHNGDINVVINMPSLDDVNGKSTALPGVALTHGDENDFEHDELSDDESLLGKHLPTPFASFGAYSQDDQIHAMGLHANTFGLLPMNNPPKFAEHSSPNYARGNRDSSAFLPDENLPGVGFVFDPHRSIAEQMQDLLMQRAPRY